MEALYKKTGVDFYRTSVLERLFSYGLIKRSLFNGNDANFVAHCLALDRRDTKSLAFGGKSHCPLQDTDGEVAHR
jgi:hypothetical protein